MCAVTDGETIAARAVIDDKIRLISKKNTSFLVGLYHQEENRTRAHERSNERWTVI